MTQPLWTIPDIIEATSGSCEDTSNQPVTGVSIDTRTLQPGDMFIAIVGDNHDGHAFVAQAFEKGASCALVSSDVQTGRTPPGPLIRVEDTLKAMEALGSKRRDQVNGDVIAVTGSVGKTGTKEMLRLCLSQQGKTHASEKSYNNHWGVPLTLARMPVDTEFGVFEIGMNHPGEITPLTQFVRPHVAIVTTVEAVHLGFFESVEQIAEAKAEIFKGLEPGGVAILNLDNPYFSLLRERAEQHGSYIISFGQDTKAESRILDISLEPEQTHVRANILGYDVAFTIGAPGVHFALNALAVLTAVQQVGGDIALATNAFQQISAQKGRGQRHVYELGQKKSVVVDESYNANPASMRAALKAFAQLPRDEFSRRIIVLGDMLELGEHSERLHLELLEVIQTAGIDLVFASGQYMAVLYDALPEVLKGAYAEKSSALEAEVLQAIRPGDAIMIKGSLGSAMGPVVAALQGHMTTLSNKDNMKK